MLQHAPVARRLAAAVSFVFAFSLPLAAQCGLDWRPGPIASGPHGTVTSVARMPNGDLIAGGYFQYADAANARCVARWDGVQWQALGEGISGGLQRVQAVATAANGDVFVGGDFTTAGGLPAASIARWDGSTWSPLGSGFNNDVFALLVLPNGDLIAGGLFTTAGGVPASRVARWNGSTWSAIGAGASGTVYALAVRPNGDLVAGVTAGGSAPNAVILWNGTTWTPIVPGSSCFTLAVLGNGDVVASTLNGTSQLVRWNGTTVVPFPSPFITPVRGLATAPNGDLVAVAGSQGGSGPAVARWDGTMWTPYSPTTPLDYAQTIAFDGNSNPVITTAAGSGVRLTAAVRRWNGTNFEGLGNPVVPPQVSALVTAANGDVYAGGQFASFGGVAAANLARWTGSAWSAFGGGVDGPVTALAAATDGSIVVGGSFQHAGGAPANRIARWNGSSWSTLAGGLAFAPTSLTTTQAGEVFATNGLDNVLARFNGSTWSSLQIPPSTGTAGPLLTRPDGTVVVGGFFGGAWLYQAGAFTALGYPGTVFQLANAPNGDLIVSGGGYIQSWNGTSWAMLAQALFTAYGLAYLPDGDLIAVGPMYFAGTQVGVWRFDGSTWSIVDGGIPVGAPKLCAVSGSGDLFVGGDNLVAGGNLSIGFAHAATNCPATVASFGAGCTGAAGPLFLQADNLPWAGGVLASTATGLPAGSLAVHAIGDASPAVPLPLGAPGCSLFVQPFLLDLLLPAAGSAHTTLGLPADPSLAGRTFRTQVVGLEFDAAAALQRLTSSNALDFVIGLL